VATVPGVELETRVALWHRSDTSACRASRAGSTRWHTDRSCARPHTANDPSHGLADGTGPELGPITMWSFTLACDPTDAALSYALHYPCALAPCPGPPVA
jgi:hypothetical protein